jgi:hypothetical protein
MRNVLLSSVDLYALRSTQYALVATSAYPHSLLALNLDRACVARWGRNGAALPDKLKRWGAPRRKLALPRRTQPCPILPPY